MSIIPIYQNFFLTNPPVKAGCADNRLKASDRRILLELSRDGHPCRRFQTTGHVRADVARADRFGDRDHGRLFVALASAAGDGLTIAGKSGWSSTSQVRSRRINDLTCEKRLATAFVVHGKDGVGMGRAAGREGGADVVRMARSIGNRAALLAGTNRAAAQMTVGGAPPDRNSHHSRLAVAHSSDATLKGAGNAVTRPALSRHSVHRHIFRRIFHARVTAVRWSRMAAFWRRLPSATPRLPFRRCAKIPGGLMTA